VLSSSSLQAVNATKAAKNRRILIFFMVNFFY